MLGAEVEAKVDEIVARYPEPKAAMLPVLSGCGGESPPKGTAEAPREGGATENRPAAKPLTVDGYRAGPVADGGRISGTIRFAGKAPAPEPVAITKDRAVCAARQWASLSREYSKVKKIRGIFFRRWVKTANFF